MLIITCLNGVTSAATRENLFLFECLTLQCCAGCELHPDVWILQPGHIMYKHHSSYPNLPKQHHVLVGRSHNLHSISGTHLVSRIYSKNMQRGSPFMQSYKMKRNITMPQYCPVNLQQSALRLSFSLLCRSHLGTIFARHLLGKRRGARTRHLPLHLTDTLPQTVLFWPEVGGVGGLHLGSSLSL